MKYQVMYVKSLIFLGFLSLFVLPSVFADIDYDSQFGSAGAGNDNLNSPTDVVLGNDGRTVYVVDSANNRINVFDDDGDYDFKFGSFCSVFSIQNCNSNALGADEAGDGQFDNPVSAALDSLDNLFVVDSDNQRIQKFDDDGRFDKKFGSTSSADPEYLGAPKGVAILDSTREIYVSDSTADAISVFNSSGDFVFDFDTFDGNDDFSNPSHLLIDDSNEILYVSDSGNDRIVVFQLVDGTTCPAGTSKVIDGVCFVKKFGTHGADNGKFDSPTGLALDATNDLLYIADTDNDRIQVFRMVDGTVCPAGTSKVVDGVCFVEKFGSSGTDNGKFNSPTGLALDTANKLLYVADTDNDRIQVLSIDVASMSFTADSPKNLVASPISTTSVMVTWNAPPEKQGIPKVTGYKIEFKAGSENYQVITDNTKNTSTSFVHNGLDSDTVYSYRVSSVNSEGTGAFSTSNTVKPDHTTTPSGLVAKAISPSQIKLTWYPPTDTFNQKIDGYQIKRVITNEVYDPVGDVDSKTTSFVVTNLATDKTYSFVVAAKIGYGYTQESPVASATPRTDSVDDSTGPNTSTVTVKSVPTAPIKLTASGISSSQINLTWEPPTVDGNSPITGYKIEVKRDSGSFATLVENTKSTSKIYSHNGLLQNSKYTYRVYAINSIGTSPPSNEITATPNPDFIKISPINKLAIDEGKTLSFIVKMTGSAGGITYSLGGTVPAGAQINSSTGMFSWTPSFSHGGSTYLFDVIATKGAMTDKHQVTIVVNDIAKSPEPSDIQEPTQEETKELGLASFVDETADPFSYVDRYNNEPSYKKWFDTNYPEYSSIYEAVGLDEPPEGPASFVEPTKDPRYYIVRYTYEPDYKKWFDDNYPEYNSIYEAVGISQSKKFDTEYGYCGTGTKLINGVCTVIDIPKEKPWWQFW